MKTKKKLLLVVGAGASIEFGMPSVSNVQSVINQGTQQFYPLACCPHMNLYQFIADAVSRYWKDVVPNHLRQEPNFEDILYAIFALAASYPAGKFTSALGALIKVKGLPDFQCPGVERKTVDGNQLHFLGSLAVDTLLDEVRRRCKSLDAMNDVKIASLREFAAALRDEFAVSVITLNYDNLLHGVMHNIEIGFDENGSFNQNRVLNRNDWPCMLHLHGSVHFDMRTGSNGDLHEIFWEPDINAQFNPNSSGRGTMANPEGIEFPTSVIVAGYGKATQLQKRPFRTYYSELDRLAETSDAILYAGYGFGDEHLNRAFDGYRDARRRPIAIIDYADDCAITAAGGSFEAMDASTIGAKLDRINIPLSQMESLQHPAPGVVKELKDQREFETCWDASGPVSIWYAGMLEACRHADKVIAALKIDKQSS